MRNSIITCAILIIAALHGVLGYFTLSGSPIFELDGNVQTDGFAYDWESLISSENVTHLLTQSGPIRATGKVFNIGNRDLHSVESWGWHHPASVHGIITAYAAAFSDKVDLLIFFAAERDPSAIGSNIDLGFWLFQDHVSPNSHGHFHGSHVDNDLLVEVSVKEQKVGVAVYKWKSGSLRNVYSHYSSCDDNDSKMPSCCAITNKDATTTSNWGNITNSHASFFKSQHFIEGGVDLHGILSQLDSMPSYASILFEHRDDGRADSQLQDFVYGSIQTSGLNFIVECANVTSSSCMVNGGYANISIKNTGSITLYNLEVFDASKNIAGTWDSIEPEEIVHVTSNPISSSYNVTASDSLSGGSQVLTSTQDFDSTQCGVTTPTLTITSSCSCTALVQGGTLLSYNHYVKIINSGSSGVSDLRVTSNSGLMPMDVTDPFCPGSEATAVTSIISSSFPYTGLIDIVTAKYGNGQTYELQTDSLTCDVSACQITPALTVATVCTSDTFTDNQQINDTVCNRGNVAIGGVCLRDSLGFNHYPSSLTIEPGTCKFALSPFVPFNAAMMEGTVTANGTSLIGSVQVQVSQKFFCYLP